ncbi:Alkaline phosphatase [Dehalogenimonas lykanthroporepellens BL-DC-9]|nr:Alkaline phosphatase [Dehalogenimonas lykanthroporepellens BL-DC-9]
MKTKKHMFRLMVTALSVTAILLTSVTGVSAKTEIKKNDANLPKNIIVMIADGWGYNQVLSTNYYQGVNKQSYELFPVKAGMSHYEVEKSNGEPIIYGYDPVAMWSDFDYAKQNATDSASSGTAIASGEKTFSGMIGWSIDGEPIYLITELAEELGKSTGVVTSVQISHATPASFVAHNASRNNYSDIANEMILSSATDVIMGAGNPYFDNDGNELSSGNFRYIGGESTWEGLLAGTIGNDANGDGSVDYWNLIQDKDDFQSLMTGETPGRIIGIAQVATTLQQSRSGNGSADPCTVPFNDNVPTLAEMSVGALNVLDADPDGFFLMIEGGAVDWAGHDNQSGRLIEEMTDYNTAVEAVINYLKANKLWDDTLLIVTGDHETGYLWGPDSGATDNGPVWNPIVNNGAGNLPGMAWYSGDHTNQLIPFFATGKGHQLVRAYLDETDPVRGKYLDNSNIGKLMFDIWDR